MKLLHTLIEQYAADFPDRIAVVDDRGEMRYGAFWARSGDIDRALIAQGFKAGDTAAVHAPYGREILVGMLGILRVGGIYI